jgi:hypothetical protein
MQTSLTVRLGAFCASVAITLALVQSMALLGHPRPVASSQLAQTGALPAPTH